MTVPTLVEMSTALSTTLAGAPSVVAAQEGITITEAIADVPLLQIYWTGSAPDETQTERRTFGGMTNASVREVKHTWHADCYVHARGEIGENVADNYALTAEVMAILNAQNDVLFGLSGIQHYHWQAERVNIENANVKYEAARFTLELWTY